MYNLKINLHHNARQANPRNNKKDFFFQHPINFRDQISKGKIVIQISKGKIFVSERLV